MPSNKILIKIIVLFIYFLIKWNLGQEEVII